MKHDADTLMRLLGGLPPAAPDSGRLSRVRARCHSVLRRRAGRCGRRARVTARELESALAAGFSALYLAALIVQAWLIYGDVP